MSFVIRLCAKGFVFYAQDQIIGDRYFLYFLFVSLSIWSVVNFNLRYNFWTLGDFIFGLHIPLRLYLQIKLDNAKRGIPSQGGKVDLDLWTHDHKSIGILPSSSTTYM